MSMLLCFHTFLRSIIDDAGFVVSSVWPSAPTLLSCHTSTGNPGSRPDLLKAQGITLLPVDAPDYFTNETPTAVLVRQILGAISQFEKASLVQKLRQARERKRLTHGRCEGRPPVPAAAKALAKRLYRKSPKTG